VVLRNAQAQDNVWNRRNSNDPIGWGGRQYYFYTRRSDAAVIALFKGVVAIGGASFVVRKTNALLTADGSAWEDLAGS